MMNYTEFDQFILSETPHFIAVNYQRLLDATTPQERVERALHIYNLGLRILTIDLVSQYLIRDQDRVSDPYLNELLLQKFHHLTLDAWQQIFFAVLWTYEGLQDLFFIPELYDFYWDTSQLPHIRRVNVEQPFIRLTQISLELQTQQLLPQDEASWKQLAEETMELLQQVLHSLAFIGKYDLIRILDSDEHSYTFELHKGLTVTVETQPVSKHVELTLGWFYLRKEPEELLFLHPLLVFWEGETEGNGLTLTDTGVYDRFIYERLQYLLAILGKTVVGEKSVARFVTLVYNTIEEAKRKRQEVEKLTWWQLREICANINKSRMATVQGKYNAKLYLQREKTCQAFEKFLTSKEKKCFILIGKSGVGKSNFILSVGEEIQNSTNDNYCVLMYDGVNLKVKPSITRCISQDFNDRLKLPGRRIENIWEEIQQIDGIENRLLILYVDAINEHPQATELLRQVDELVQKPWPWIKVVISSRPETWQAIKRGVRLSERLYYREEGAETIGVELEPFSYSEKMEPFSQQELPEVYAKYHQVFSLQTPYKTLRSDLRELLRDPLSLWLVAKTYQGRSIPETLKSTELVAKYVNTLLRSERLQDEDLWLLEARLVPLMIREGHYTNVVTIADVDAAGERLYEAIYSEQILSDGRRVNQSFTNLLDADILIKQGGGRDQKITFKYERFYEYFVGRRIFELSTSQTDKPRFFTQMISQVNTVPFLWGAIKNALIQETIEPGAETVLTLCFTDQQRVKEMMVHFLSDFGRDNSTKVEMILECLLPSKEKMNRFRSFLQLIGKVNIETDVSTRNARKIAVEVASNLGIAGILQTAAMQANPTIRTVAVRYTYYLWERNPDTGFSVLEYLAQSATRGIIPNFAALESALGLSLVIFFDHYQDQIILKRLQKIWRRIIAKFLSIKESSNRFKRLSQAFIRDRIVSIVISIVFRLLREFYIYSTTNYSSIETFFQLDDEEKAFYKRLIQYIDIERNYSTKQKEEDFLAVLKNRNYLIRSIAKMGLIAHIIQRPHEILPFLKNFFEEARRDQLPSPYLHDIPFLLTGILDRNPKLDNIFDFFVYTVEVCQSYYAKHQHVPGLREDICYEAEALYIGPYIGYQYQRTGAVETSWLETRINNAFVKKNAKFFELLLKTELPLVGINGRQPEVALDVITLFFNRCDVEIQQMVLSFLARLRIYYPDEVDDFLKKQQVSDEIRLHVIIDEPRETIGELIGVRSWGFIRDEIIVRSPTLRTRLIQILTKATDCKNIRQWVDFIFREIINLVYNEEILRQIK